MFGKLDGLKIAFGMIISAFLLLFVATFYTFKVALRDGPVELVDKNYYQIGLNYEKSLAEKRKFQEEGYRFELLTQNLSLGRNDVQVLYLKGAEFLQKEKLILMVEKGATDKYNQVLDLQSGKDFYYTTLDIPQNGKWILTVKDPQNNFTQTFTVQVP